MSFHKLIGLSDRDRSEILQVLGLNSSSQLFEVIPESSRLNELKLPDPMVEFDLHKHIASLAAKNKTTIDLDLYLGYGCYEHEVPSVIDSIVSKG